MAIYFARHGQTIGGSEDRLEGASNSLLTSKGREQAIALAQYVQNLNIARITASPLGRAQETAHIVGDRIGCRVMISEGWREMSYGEWDGQRKRDLKLQPQWSEREKNKFFFIHPGSHEDRKGESYQILSERLQQPLLNLAKNFPQENILIVCHNGVLRSIKKFFLKLTPEQTIEFSPSNSTLLKIEKSAAITVETIDYQQ